MFSLFKKPKDSFLELVDKLKNNSGSFYFGTLVGQPADDIVKNLTNEPHSLFVGSMGSGKSVSAVASTLAYTLANPQDLILVVDGLKGAQDFMPLYGYQRVLPFVGDDRYIKGCIEFLYEELKVRQGLFQSVGASNIKMYHEKSQKPLARVMLIWEEAHILNNLLKYDYDESKPGTYAGKFKTIIRIGRSYGITVSLITQRCLPGDIPNAVVRMISNVCAFRLPKSDANYLNLPEASTLMVNEKGMAINSSGRVQFPYIPMEKAKEYVAEDKKQNDGVPQLASVSQVGLQQLKQTPSNILSPQFYRKMTMLDEAEVMEDLEFWEFVEKGPKAIKE